MKYNIQYKGILIFIAVMTVVFGLFGFDFNTANAALNKQINYQGKLFTGTNTPVSDGGYNIKYRLYTTSTGGSPIWTETLCYSSDNGNTCDGTGTDNRASVSNGLFSTMLGSVTSLDGVDFNQTLYLGVEIGGNSASSATWDGEMTPRKKIGTVPSAFEADKLDGLSSEQFIRSDADNATTSSSTFLNIIQSGAGKVAEFIGQGSASVLSILSDGKVGIGTTTPTDTLSVNGPIFLADTAPVSTANRIYANGGSLYYAGNLIGGASVGNWTSNGTDVWRPTGTVGVGTTTPFANFAINPIAGSASNQFVIGSSTATNFIVDNSGNIGVGTASPSAKVHISGTGSPFEALRLQNTTISQSVDLTFNTKDSGNTNRERARIKVDTGNSTDAGKLTFQVLRNLSEVDALTLIGGVATSEAFVGVGSSSPYAKLAVTNLGSNASFIVEDSASPDASPFIIDAAGLVGIGTSTPDTQLTIYAGTLVDKNAVSIYGYNGSTNEKTMIRMMSGNRDYTWGVRFGSARDTSTSGGATAGDAFVINTKVNGGVDTERFRVSKDGDIGIGTTSPLARLDVVGPSSGTRPLFQVSSATSFATTTRFMVDGSGNVGIGTTSPSGLLHLSTSGSDDNFFQDSFGGQNNFIGRRANGTISVPTAILLDNTMLQLSGRGYDGTSMGTGSRAYMQFNAAQNWSTTANGTYIRFFTTTNDTTTANERLRIDNTGNVGIGTTTPWGLLSVNPSGITGPSFVIGSSTATNFVVTNGGLVGIGSSNPTTARLDVRDAGTTASSILDVHQDDGSPWIAQLIRDDLTNAKLGFTFDASGNFVFRNQHATGDLYFNIANSSTPSMVLTDAGNVGIGTTTPYANLSVLGGSTASDTLLALNNRFRFQGDGVMKWGVTANAGLLSWGATNAIVGSQSGYDLSLYANGGEKMKITTAGLVGISSTTPYASLSVTNTGTNPSFVVEDSTSPDTTPFIIDASGNVGIGTTSPGSILPSGFSSGRYVEVVSDTTGTDTGLFLRRSSGASQVGLDVWIDNSQGASYIDSRYNDPTGNIYFRTKTSATPVVALTILGSGNVGIGTSSPGQLLEVYSNSTNPVIKISNGLSGSFPIIQLADTRTNGHVWNIESGRTLGQLSFRDGTAAVERMTIKGDGNVGIGTTTPYAKLAITNTGSDPSFVVEDSTSPDTTPFMIDASGNVGVGTSSPESSLNVIGTIRVGTQYGAMTEMATNEIRAKWVNDASSIYRFRLTNNVGTMETALGGFVGGALKLSDSTATGSSTIYARSGGVAFYTNNNTSMLLTSAGSLGLGTTTPTSQLHVSGTAPDIRQQVTSGTNFYTLTSDLNFSASDAWNLTFDTVSGASDSIIQYDSPDISKILTLGVNGGSTVLRGNIGIATSSPYAQLSVGGNSITNTLFALDALSGQTAPIVDIKLASSSKFVINSSGNVGVGVTSPSYKLDVDGSMRLGANSGSVQPVLGRNTGGGLSIDTSGSISSSNNLLTVANNGGTALVTVLGGGNVGIGTTSPSDLLHIYGATGKGVTLDNTGVVAGNGAALTFNQTYLSSNAVGRIQSTLVSASDSTARRAGMSFSIKKNGDALGTLTEAMRIDESGNVGIGTTSPDIYSLGLTKHLTLSTNGASVSSAALTIAGGTTGRARLDLGNESILRAGVWGIDGSHLTFNTNTSNSGTTLTEAMRITSAGNVGIGTTSPTQLLSLRRTSDAFIDIDVVAPSNSAGLFLSGGNNFGIRTNGNGLNFVTGTASSNSIKMTMDSNGDIGIGTTSPWGKLAITNTGTDPSFVVEDSTSPDTTPFIIDANGKVGIGISNPSQTLDVNGYINIANARGLRWANGNAEIINSTYDMLLKTYDGAALTEKMRITSAGNVGIGSSTPNAILTVVNSATTTANTPLLFVASTTNGTATSTFLTVQADGKVGIGTAGPTQLLSLYKAASDVAAYVQSDSGSQAALFLGSTNTAVFRPAGTTRLGLYNTSERLSVLATGEVGIGSTTPWGQLSVNPNGITGPAFVIGSSTATNFIVTNGGLVGIGSSNPTADLFVKVASYGAPATSGSAAFSGFRLGTQTSVSMDMGINGNVNPSYAWIQPRNAGDNSINYNLVLNQNGGNVGIGTTSPYATLSVVGNVVASNFTATSTTATSTFAGGVDFGSGNFTYDTYTGVTSVSSLQTGNMNFETDAGQVSWTDMSLSSTPSDTPVGYTAFLNGSSTISVYGLSAGNGWLKDDYPRVAIGSTTAPSSKLTVFGNGTGTNGTFEVVNSASTTLMKILDNGSVGIASTSPWKTFSVNGTVAMNGLTSSATGNALCITTSKEITDAGGASCTPSSIRFKENVSPMQTGYALDLLSKLSIVDFDYIEKQQYETNHSYGMIAEDVEKIDKNLVDYGYDGKPVSLHFEKITGLLVQAVQEQEGKIGDISSTTSRLDLTSSQLVASNALNITNINSKIDVLSDVVANLNSSSTLIAKLASSTAEILASSTEASLINSTSFMDKIFLSFMNYLTTAMTKVKGIFVNEIHIEDKLCVDDVCINKDQLKTLILQATASSTNNTNIPAVNQQTIIDNNPVVTLPPATPDNGSTTQTQIQASSTTVINENPAPTPEAPVTSTTTPVVENPTPTTPASTPVVESDPVVETTPTAPVTESAPAPAPTGESAPQS